MQTDRQWSKTKLEDPQVSWGEQVHGMWYFSFSAPTLLVGRQEGYPACKTLGVDLLVVMIWLELRTSYSSSCHHCFTITLASIKLADQGLPGKMVWPLKRRDMQTERQRDRQTLTSVCEHIELGVGPRLSRGMPRPCRQADWRLSTSQRPRWPDDRPDYDTPLQLSGPRSSPSDLYKYQPIT